MKIQGLFNRVEAAAYVSERFFDLSPKTLAKYACVGGGPTYRKVGRVPAYEAADLDAWASAKIGPKITRSPLPAADEPVIVAGPGAAWSQEEIESLRDGLRARRSAAG